MLGFAVFAVGLAMIGLWLYHDRSKPVVEGRPMDWKEIALIFLAVVAVVIIGVIRSAVFI